jgi:hypothetical protein
MASVLLRAQFTKLKDLSDAAPVMSDAFVPQTPGD